MSLFPQAVVLARPVTPTDPAVPAAMVRFTPAANSTSSVGLGASVAWAGDTDGDRFGEFVVGAPFADEIFGFVRGEDVILFRGVQGIVSVSGFAASNAFAAQVAEGGALVDRTNVRIVGRDGSLIHVYGLGANATLTAADFVFGG